MSEDEEENNIPQEGYICTVDCLDSPLEGELLNRFHRIFNENWRMNFKNCSPQQFWSRFGIDDFENPTVRAAVAIDLVKLDDDSVSNDCIYTWDWHLNYSPEEYERLILNRNYRINLVNLEDGWTDIQYGDGTVETKRTVDRVFQGAVFSETFLQYFDRIFKNIENPLDAHIPFTCESDFTTEFSLVPNAHRLFDPIFFRSYYDSRYSNYRGLLEKYGIEAISTFALVDCGKDKNHTGKWRVKVQRKKNADGLKRYSYIVFTVDIDGRIQTDSDGKPDITAWESDENSILCVCERDFLRDFLDESRDSESTESASRPQIGFIPMVHSTTSSHYSVFRQRIPDYDLSEVRHYVQFRNRLEGMELMLDHLKRNIELKEVHASECFAKETMAIGSLFEDFNRHQELMELIVEYYGYVDEYDELYQRLVKLRSLKDEKQDLLRRLIREYNELSDPSIDGELTVKPDKNLGEKIGLGEKIKSLKLELNKSLKDSIDAIIQRLKKIVSSVEGINRRIVDVQKIEYVDMDSKEVQDELAEMRTVFGDDEDSDFNKAKREIKEKADKMVGEEQEEDGQTDGTPDDEDNIDYNQLMLDIVARNIGAWKRTHDTRFLEGESIQKCEDISDIDTTKLHDMVLSTERWRNYMQSMGYELNQMRKMWTMCEDATIKVRRLVHNFEERMKETEKLIWDENHQIRPDFDFGGISMPGLKDIILLHDWYAVNAPNKTYLEMGFDDEEQFTEFRRKCNNVSYNLRINQYAQLIDVNLNRTQNRILEIQSRIADENTLHWKDKYGKDAIVDDDGKSWTVKDYLLKGGTRKASVFSKAEKTLKKIQSENARNKIDIELMRERTVNYLKRIGLVKSEDELESLALRNAVANYKGDTVSEIEKVEKAKNELDIAVSKMNRQRDALKSIINGITDAERKISELEESNRRIFNACLTERNRQNRNRLLLQKLDNESRIAELRSTVEETRKKNLSDFSSLGRMRKDVDEKQSEYDDLTEKFKNTVGLDENAIENLMVGIYNRFQDEILSIKQEVK